MPTFMLAPVTGPVSVVPRAGGDRDAVGAGRRGAGDRPPAGPRSPSTISRELRRNAATRGGKLDYRASVAQWKAELLARRPKTAKLVANERLREYVQERLVRAGPPPGRDTGGGAGDGAVEGPEQAASPGPAVGDGVEPGADLAPAAGRLPRR